MPKLTITYKDQVVFDSEVSEFSWTENANSVTVKARVGDAPAGASGGGLMSILERAAASQKAKTAARAGELRLAASAGESVENPDGPDDGDGEVDPVAKRNTS